jgi:hypothetical protein
LDCLIEAAEIDHFAGIFSEDRAKFVARCRPCGPLSCAQRIVALASGIRVRFSFSIMLACRARRAVTELFLNNWSD